MQDENWTVVETTVRPTNKLRNTDILNWLYQCHLVLSQPLKTSERVLYANQAW